MKFNVLQAVEILPDNTSLVIVDEREAVTCFGLNKK